MSPHASQFWTQKSPEMKKIGNSGLILFGYIRSWDAYAVLPANLAGLQLFSEEFVKQLFAYSMLKSVNIALLVECCL